jgi:hypothetical protein
LLSHDALTSYMFNILASKLFILIWAFRGHWNKPDHTSIWLGNAQHLLIWCEEYFAVKTLWYMFWSHTHKCYKFCKLNLKYWIGSCKVTHAIRTLDFNCHHCTNAFIKFSNYSAFPALYHE